MPDTTDVVQPAYLSIASVTDICGIWIDMWGGDEWGDSMRALSNACATSHGFSDEYCAMFANCLLANLLEQKEWVDEEGYRNGMWEAEDINQAQKLSEERRDYWVAGGNLGPSAGLEAITEVQETLAKLPAWMFGGDTAAPVFMSVKQKLALKDALSTLRDSEAFAYDMEQANHHSMFDDLDAFEAALDRGNYRDHAS